MCRLLFGMIIVSWTRYLVTKPAWRFLLPWPKVDGESPILLFARYRALAVGWGVAKFVTNGGMFLTNLTV